MQKITQITQADVGRIAVSLDGVLRVQLMSVSENELKHNHVKKLECNGFSNDTTGKETFNFALINGIKDMFWEDEIKPAKPMTKFECWCAEKGYDPKGQFVYTEKTKDVWISDLFNKGDILTLYKDDNSSCPRFINQLDVFAFEEFDGGCCQLQPYTHETKQELKQAKPRFYKKRQKPPVRVKTDVKLFYKTGEEYTFKNVSAVEFTSSTGLSVEKVNKISKGIAEFSSSRVAWELIDSVTVVSPEGVTFLSVVAEDKFEIIAEKMQAVAHSFYEFYKIK